MGKLIPDRKGTTLVLDLETSTGTSFKRKANPFDLNNQIVMSGWKRGTGACEGKYMGKGDMLPDLDGIRLLVGFNLKFDLLYLWKHPRLIKFLKEGGRIYDCQYAEFLLEGMHRGVQMANLSDTSVKYGGTHKLDVVKELWKKGVKTEDIPKDTLTAYLLGSVEDEVEGDINSTYRVFKAQIEEIKKLPDPGAFTAMMKNRFDGLLATTEMEWNGLLVDEKIGEEQRLEQLESIKVNEAILKGFIPELPPEVEFNWSSPAHKSAIIFGGPIKYEKWVAHEDAAGNKIYPKKTEKWPLFAGEAVNPLRPTSTIKLIDSYYYIELFKGFPGAVKGKTGWWLKQDCFKSGKQQGLPKFKNVQVDNLDKPKGKKQIFAFDLPGFVKPREEWKVSNLDVDGNAQYSTGEKVMTALAEMKEVPFCRALSEYIASVKDLGTYYWKEDKNGNLTGMLTLVYPDGVIHHKLNHTSVVTGRMSSNDPNMQNISRKDKSKIKKVFRSRFKDGVMVGIDFHQLEILVQAILTGDKNLIADIRNKIDFHCRRLSSITGESYESILEKYKTGDDKITELRVAAKGFSFQRAFGAGPTAVAASTGLSIETVKEMIKAEELMYPDVSMFDLRMKETINNGMTGKIKVITKNGWTWGKYSKWQSPTGTVYRWDQKEAPDWVEDELTFSPTERKNYPVQGTGGEIVQTVLGKLFRWWIQLPDTAKEQLLMVNTVHDCVIWDGTPSMVDKYIDKIVEIMESVHVWYKEDLGIDLPVQFEVDTEIGEDLYDTIKLNEWRQRNDKAPW